MFNPNNTYYYVFPLLNNIIMFILGKNLFNTK